MAREWTIAPLLAAAGADPGWCERVATALPAPALEPGLEWVASALSIGALLDEMKELTRRISELVAAIKSYSQMDRASVQQVDVTDGIESALVMVGHKLRGDGVTVVREYAADVPRIGAYPGELNQVWASLIDNALDAMAGAGVLRLATRAEPDGVLIEVGDTGPGMPPEVAARAFDPFYTTKEAAQSTGLGLDIARRTVVERHGGSITIESQPGDTVLRVRLPLRQPLSQRRHQVGRSGPCGAIRSRSSRSAWNRRSPRAAAHGRTVSAMAASAARVQAQPLSVSVISRARASSGCGCRCT